MTPAAHLNCPACGGAGRVDQGLRCLVCAGRGWTTRTCKGTGELRATDGRFGVKPRRQRFLAECFGCSAHNCPARKEPIR